MSTVLRLETYTRFLRSAVIITLGRQRQKMMSSSPACAVEQDPVHNALPSPKVLQVKDKTPPWPSHKTSEGWGHSSVGVVLAQQAVSPGFSLQLHRWSVRHTHL